MYRFFQNKSNSDVSMIMKVSFMLFWSIASLLVETSLGEEITSRYHATDIYQVCYWYRFPTKIQRLIPIIVNGIQQSGILRAYAKTSCSRKTFKKVTAADTKYTFKTQSYD